MRIDDPDNNAEQKSIIAKLPTGAGGCLKDLAVTQDLFGDGAPEGNFKLDMCVCKEDLCNDDIEAMETKLGTGSGDEKSGATILALNAGLIAFFAFTFIYMN